MHKEDEIIKQFLYPEDPKETRLLDLYKQSMNVEGIFPKVIIDWYEDENGEPLLISKIMIKSK